jgi:hypothetical protein
MLWHSKVCFIVNFSASKTSLVFSWSVFKRSFCSQSKCLPLKHVICSCDVSMSSRTQTTLNMLNYLAILHQVQSTDNLSLAPHYSSLQKITFNVFSPLFFCGVTTSCLFDDRRKRTLWVPSPVLTLVKTITDVAFTRGSRCHNRLRKIVRWSLLIAKIWV